MKQVSKSKKQKRKTRISRLFWADVVALLVLLTVTAAVLQALGLLGSIFAFFF